jgi:hypothetical protein
LMLIVIIFLIFIIFVGGHLCFSYWWIVLKNLYLISKLNSIVTSLNPWSLRLRRSCILQWEFLI